ncbi:MULTISPECIES: response regulator [Vibrio]|uniref:response regulator n=1 Tax=Vibrio TaxID=662 RepID=UPI0001B950A4|nr:MULTISPECIES: response regulator [Vibrio]EEX31504.1 autoinducer 1 sensor kinase/phosphatase luxN [Vibrio coralliilyticus ATCC BAA-450]MCM5506830.1 response regulator [Vibrio sp. SCSIO 43169]MDE3898693.1 response regulator [Vibrio sp. CC007]QFT36837.1 Autoinducer 1 sensor kinase/phosphatase LuxN [Vibrio sp. THAF64]QGM34738.1 Autoinducer 1 sensor kinase/phosphatase LuxN [Vibrio sp. THAF191d]
MFSYMLDQVSYPKAMVLIGAALSLLIWAVYFCSAIIKRYGKDGMRLYYYYILYMAGLFVWIISNSYFHTDLLKAFGNSAAVNVAIIANLATLVAFVSAYLFSAKLHNFYAQKSIGHWQSAVVVITIIFAVSCNLIPGLTVRGISIIGPSDFELDFGPYTKPFFLGLAILVTLTLVNLISLKNNPNLIRRTRVIYMIWGMTIFMLSTVIIQLGFTLFFDDFSLTWLPPTLSVREVLFMGYAILTSRFYSPRYISYIMTSFTITAFAYAGFISSFYSFENTSISELALVALIIGVSWPKVYKTIQLTSCKLFYGESLSPVAKIALLEEDFHKSPTQAMVKLAKYLGVPKGKLRLLDNYQGANVYQHYFEKQSTPLVIDEVEERIAQTSDTTLNLVHRNMKETQSALVLPIYDNNKDLSHVLVSSSKSEGAYFSYEELSALEHVLQKVQLHITYEQKVRQSQALANSIAHEMRNPLTQVQLEFENLAQKIDGRQSYQDLASHVGSGKQAIARGKQLIDIILREIDNTSLDQEPATACSITSAVTSAVNQYGFDDDSLRSRVMLETRDDFIVEINNTLFNFVMFNLLRNAVYYFESYPESIITIRTEKGQNRNTVMFTDTGPGIPQTYLARIFDDFFSHNKSGGSGLGLGYCKRVMKAFGGSIRCDSKIGEYTTFYLNFPVTSDKVEECQINESVVTSGNVGTLPTLPPTSELTPTTNPDKPLILVVDDKRVQLSLAKLYLEQLGYNVLLANNGKIAVEMVQNNPIDLVFMDIQMPVMDGFEAATLIKRSHPSLPIIALSGESGEKELKRISELMDGRLSKPTSKQALNQILISALPTTMQ